MPKLLTVHNYHYRRGGAETVCLDQIGLFTEHGWDVASFAMHHPSNDPTAWSRYFADEIEFGRQPSLGAKLRDAAKIIYSHEAKAKIQTMIRDIRPDVVHAHSIYHHLSPSVLVGAKREGVPVVLTLHDLKLLCPAYAMYSRNEICERCKPNALHHVVMRKCLKNSLALSGLVFVESALHRALSIYKKHVDCFIAPSRFLMNRFIDWGWDPRVFSYVPNAVPAASIKPEMAVGQAFVYLGRLADGKGIKTLVLAAAQAQAPLKVVGTGPQEAELKALAGSSNGQIEFLGYRKGEPLWDVVRSARAVVMPAEAYENAPVSILEAYAFGKPVIGSNLGGIPELIREGQTGSIFTPARVDELAQRLIEYQDLPNSRIQEMGQAGRAWVLEDFSPQIQYERICQVYRDIGVAISTGL